MIVLGLTGSVAMGKTRTARLLERLGVPVFDSDAASRRLTAPGGASVPEVGRAFPGLVRDGRIDREGLGRLAFADPDALRRLEAILHPRISAERRSWLRRMALSRRPVVALDIPLLFETGSERLCDLVLVVSAPGFLQRQRALRRPGMDGARLAGVLARQLPDPEKRRRADVVIGTGLGQRPVLLALAGILRRIRARRPRRRRA